MEPRPRKQNWFEVAEASEIPSPSLLIYLERVEHNLRQMLVLARSSDRLRPHIKTHKTRELVDMQLALGIRKFKCATLAEAELAAEANVPDLLVAYQLVGPAVPHFLQLVRRFPQTQFSVIGDNAIAIRELSKAVQDQFVSIPTPRLEVLLDLDLGMGRTGVRIGPQAAELYRLIADSPGLAPGGLHAYDGHIGDTDLAKRTAACESTFASVDAFRHELIRAGLSVPRIVAGGSPTFPMHARRPDVECSPGTCVLWDAGYSKKLPDLPFQPAAVLLSRVISKPGENRLCLDLGHKAVGSEMPHPRVDFLDLEDAQPVAHSEEHLVIETVHSGSYTLGDCLYGIPWHVCPTMALHSAALIVKDRKVVGSWKVAARDRR